MSLSRVTTFTPGSEQTVTGTFTNTMLAPASGVTLSLSLPSGWTAVVSGTRKPSMTFGPPVPPGASVNATFEVASPAATGAGFLIGRAEWTDPSASGTRSETTTARIRNFPPIKINEVRFSAGANPTDQFIELYNASAGAVDLSNWTLINTQSQWAGVKLATIPAGTKLASGDYYLLALSTSGLAAAARAGATPHNDRTVAGR